MIEILERPTFTTAYEIFADTMWQHSPSGKYDVIAASPDLVNARDFLSSIGMASDAVMRSFLRAHNDVLATQAEDRQRNLDEAYVDAIINEVIQKFNRRDDFQGHHNHD